MADNSKQTLVNRLARSPVSIPGVVVPPMPEVPKVFVKRFPEWAGYQREMERWREMLQQELGKALTQDNRG